MREVVAASITDMVKRRAPSKHYVRAPPPLPPCWLCVCCLRAVHCARRASGWAGGAADASLGLGARDDGGAGASCDPTVTAAGIRHRGGVVRRQPSHNLPAILAVLRLPCPPRRPPPHACGAQAWRTRQVKLLDDFPVPEGGVRSIPFLPGKKLVGRSHIKRVAEERCGDGGALLWHPVAHTQACVQAAAAQ